MRFSEARKRDVVSTATATKVARVAGFVVEASPARVVALKLAKVTVEGTMVGWDDVQGFGPDAVTIADVVVIRPARDETERRAESGKLDVLGARALTERGDELGTITDVDFDPETGAVTSLLVGGEDVAGERLLGVGGYAVVLTADAPAGSPTDPD